MKDRIFYAREEVRYAIEILTKLETPEHVAHHTHLPHYPHQPPPPIHANLDIPIINISMTVKPPATSIPKQIEAIRGTLAAKKMHLRQISQLLEETSTRFQQTLLNETKFYQSVAVGQLRPHNWILHSKEERSGRGIFVDYGLSKGLLVVWEDMHLRIMSYTAGSTSTEITEAYFTWSSSTAATSSSTTASTPATAKITLKYAHGAPRLTTLTYKSQKSLPPLQNTHLSTYTKLQRALATAKQYAFETELFREISRAAVVLPGAKVSATSVEFPAPNLRLEFGKPSVVGAVNLDVRDGDSRAGFLLVSLKKGLRRCHRANSARFLGVDGIRMWEEGVYKKRVQRAQKNAKRRVVEEEKGEEEEEVLPGFILHSTLSVCQYLEAVDSISEALEQICARLREMDWGESASWWGELDVTTERQVFATEGKTTWDIRVFGRCVTRVSVHKSGLICVELECDEIDEGSRKLKKHKVKDVDMMKEYVEQDVRRAVDAF
ncbi:hypothetical protein BCR33DRAFT_763981 [Rhizoclosmatium globosum]|uniref:Mediator of RNA polymerase II transcription subunit 17 n=1 Tax=Rhizoclosmatium globosum TaxID=329046 RepID=A0A1Y2CMW1_9FUNG|nr:hypothetical protein BCR33DRAFT_763981 [Rhizoclosmatium globosum]|eukprot:ORY48276.1 hypothetical protein BCR33DRAFT_763981 [Rhizoclosmatium globosum]